MSSNITISTGATDDIVLSGGTFTDDPTPTAPSVINATELQTALGNGPVTIDTGSSEGEAGNILFTASVAGGGNLSLIAGANVAQGAGTLALDTLSVSAAGGVSLNQSGNAIGTLQTVNAANFAFADNSTLTVGGNITTSSGAAFLTVDGDMTVNGHITAAGAVALTATGSISDFGAVSAQGITITATDNGSAGNSIIIGDSTPVTWQAGAGDINIQAGDNLTVGTGMSLQATGAVHLVVDAGDADSGTGATAIINGTITAASVSLTGGSDADTLTNNTATGMTIDGGGGNDTLTGGSGADTLIGGGGTDVAVFTGNRADYTITYTSGTTLQVSHTGGSHADGADTVSGVETFRFADGDKSYADLVSDPTVNAQPAVNSIVRAVGTHASVPAADTSVSYTVTFSEAVTGVDAGDFTLTTTGNASGSIAGISGSGTTYTVTVDTVAGNGTLRLDLNGSGTGIVDSASAPISGGYTAGQLFTLDHMAPTTTVGSLALSGDTGASASDFVTKTAAQTISGVLSSALASGDSLQVSLDNGASWTNVSVASGATSWTLSATLLGSNTIQARVVDAVGNAGVATSQAYVLDTTAPAAPNATLASDTGVSASDGVTTSGSVNVGSVEPSGHFEYSTNGGTSWTTGSGSTFDLASGTYAAGQVLVRQTDLAGNTSTNASLGSVAVDVTPPTATIAFADAALTVGETSLVTFTFSEKVSGFTNADLSVENGSLSSVATADDGLTWTATFTPTTNINDATNVISLDRAGIADIAGNAGVGVATSSNYTIDTTVPTPPLPPITEGTSGDDAITAGTLTTPIFGGAGSDSITSTPLAGTTAHLYGGSGFLDPTDVGDTISITGGGSADVYGNGGDDVIVFNASGTANIFGGVGDDRVTVTNDANNAVTGGPGGDTITISGNGSNLVLGGATVNDPTDGADTIRVNGNGDNVVYANGGNDTVIVAGTGNNTVFGGFGNDTIVGGSGNDVIVGGPGANVLTGGGGADRFVHAAGGLDSIQDFSFVQGDRLELGGQAYTVVSAADGSAALVFGDGGAIVLAGVSEAAFQSSFVA